MADQDLGSNPTRELLRRFFVTFLLGVIVFRLGSYIPIPGVDAKALQDFVTGGDSSGDPVAAILKWANMFSGGALAQASIFGLGITPYISASIIFQLLTYSIPSLKALQKEGETGRRKINQYTRYATLVIATVQSLIAAIALYHATVSIDGRDVKLVQDLGFWQFVPGAMLVIVTGCMLILWISEQITRYGIGNGVSVVIMIGILAFIPSALGGAGEDLTAWIVHIAFALALIAGIVVVVQALRRVNLEQQRRVLGNKVYGGAQTSLPLKLNQANVIPVIFASPVMVLIGMAFANPWGASIGLDLLLAQSTPLYNYVFALLIIGFTYFYISITFDLNDMSNHFKQAGFFVRGIKPGKNTVDHLATILKRITFVGAIFLAVIAILPNIIGGASGTQRGAALLLGGTGLLIVVGVMLDVMQKVSAFFLAHQYRGLDGATKKSGKRF
jgi:preprotein translocase subunit SecY